MSISGSRIQVRAFVALVLVLSANQIYSEELTKKQLALWPNLSEQAKMSCVLGLYMGFEAASQITYSGIFLSKAFPAKTISEIEDISARIHIIRSILPDRFESEVFFGFLLEVKRYFDNYYEDERNWNVALDQCFLIFVKDRL